MKSRKTAMKFYNSQFFKKLIKLINSSKTGKEKERKRKLKSQHQNVTTNAAGTKRIGENYNWILCQQHKLQRQMKRKKTCFKELNSKSKTSSQRKLHANIWDQQQSW